MENVEITFDRMVHLLRGVLDEIGLNPPEIPDGQTAIQNVIPVMETLGIMSGILAESIEDFGQQVVNVYGNEAWVPATRAALTASIYVQKQPSEESTLVAAITRARLGAMALDVAIRQVDHPASALICGPVTEAMMWSCNAAEAILVSDSSPASDDVDEVLARTMQLREDALRAALDHTPGQDTTGHDDTPTGTQ